MTITNIGHQKATEKDEKQITISSTFPNQREHVDHTMVTSVLFPN